MFCKINLLFITLRQDTLLILGYLHQGNLPPLLIILPSLFWYRIKKEICLKDTIKVLEAGLKQLAKALPWLVELNFSGTENPRWPEIVQIVASCQTLLTCQNLSSQRCIYDYNPLVLNSELFFSHTGCLPWLKSLVCPVILSIAWVRKKKWFHIFPKDIRVKWATYFELFFYIGCLPQLESSVFPHTLYLDPKALGTSYSSDFLPHHRVCLFGWRSYPSVGDIVNIFKDPPTLC